MAYIVKKSDIEIILQTQNQAWKEFLKGCIRDPNTTLHHDTKGCIAVNDGGNVVLLDHSEYRVAYIKKVIDALDFKGNFYITDEPLDEDGYTLLELNINKYVVVEPTIIERYIDDAGNSVEPTIVEVEKIVEVERVVEVPTTETQVVEKIVEVPVETVVERVVEVAPKYEPGIIYQANKKGNLQVWDPINSPKVIINDTWKRVYPYNAGSEYNKAGYLTELIINNMPQWQLSKWEKGKGRVGIDIYNTKEEGLSAQNAFITS